MSIFSLIITCVSVVAILISTLSAPTTSQLAYITQNAERTRNTIQILDIERRLITEVFHSYQQIVALEWSPDGNRFYIAMFHVNSSTRDIAEINLRNGDFRWITDGPYDNHGPDISPDGRFMVYQTYGIEGTGWNIAMMDLITGEAWDVYAGAGNEGRPRWSPDGMTIIFEAQVGLSSSLVTVAPDGTGFSLLSADLDYAPAWSPTGELIAFVSSRDNNFDLYMIAPDSSGLRRLTDHASADFYPAWSPDSQHLAFTSRRGGDHFDQIYLLSFVGNNILVPQRLTNYDHNHLAPVWHP